MSVESRQQQQQQEQEEQWQQAQQEQDQEQQLSDLSELDEEHFRQFEEIIQISSEFENQSRSASVRYKQSFDLKQQAQKPDIQFLQEDFNDAEGKQMALIDYKHYKHIDRTLPEVKSLKDQNKIANEKINAVKESISISEEEKQRIKDELQKQRLDEQRRNQQEKLILKKFMELEPRSNQSLKQYHIKRKKFISKKTLYVLCLKFDEFYAYERNVNYSGPKLSLIKIAESLDLGRKTVHKLYTEWMEDPSFKNRMIKACTNQRIPDHKLAIDRMEHLARLIKNNPFMSQVELCVQLNKCEDLKYRKDGKLLEITTTVVSRLLKAGKFKKKRVRCVPKEKNTTKSLEKRFEYCTKYSEILQKKSRVYFLDESGFNLYMTREKAWSRPKEEITVNCPISKGKRFSLIAIIGVDGLAHWRIIEGTFRKYEYLNFIGEMFEKVMEKKEDEDDRDIWLILDNCAIHDKVETSRLAAEKNINILYLPAYSPQLNPIENWFHEVKTKVRKSNYSGEEQMLSVMERILSAYEIYDYSHYFVGTEKFVEKGIKREKF